MEKINRRELFKLGLTASGTLLVANNFISFSQAATTCDDSQITTQGYVTDAAKIDAKSKDYEKFKSTSKSIVDLGTKNKKSTKDLIANCGNCKLYKSKTTDCGLCPMVGATGTPGKFVKSSGWCKVYMADATKLK